MPRSKNPKLALNAAAKITTGPGGLTMYTDGTIPPASLTRFRELVADPCAPPFTDTLGYIGQNGVAFLKNYVYALAETENGQAALSKALCVQNMLPSFDNIVGGVGILGPIVQNLPLAHRITILEDECGLDNVRQAGNADDIIRETLLHLDDADKITVIEAFDWPIRYLIDWLDQMPPASRDVCLTSTHLMWEFGMIYLHHNQEGKAPVLQALARWNATEFLETLHTLPHLSDDASMQWFDAPRIIPATERIIAPPAQAATPPPQTKAPAVDPGDFDIWL